jgi:hypothetical protein
VWNDGTKIEEVEEEKITSSPFRRWIVPKLAFFCSSRNSGPLLGFRLIGIFINARVKAQSPLLSRSWRASSFFKRSPLKILDEETKLSVMGVFFGWESKKKHFIFRNSLIWFLKIKIEADFFFFSLSSLLYFMNHVVRIAAKMYPQIQKTKIQQQIVWNGAEGFLFNLIDEDDDDDDEEDDGIQSGTHCVENFTFEHAFLMLTKSDPLWIRFKEGENNWWTTLLWKLDAELEFSFPETEDEDDDDK